MARAAAACLHAILEALAAVELVQQHRHEAVAVGLQEVVPAGSTERHLPQRRLSIRRPHLQGFGCTMGAALPPAAGLVRLNGTSPIYTSHTTSQCMVTTNSRHLYSVSRTYHHVAFGQQDAVACPLVYLHGTMSKVF
jgi:hypothetical protein